MKGLPVRSNTEKINGPFGNKAVDENPVINIETKIATKIATEIV